MTQVRTPALGTGLLALVLTAGVVAPALADPSGDDGSGTPSAADVRDAQADARAAKSEVGVVREQLAAADAAVDAASERAARAAEAWNGARWKAQQAQAAERTATAASVRADRTLEVQRASYGELVIATSTAGTDLEAASALVAADGMESLLEEASAKERVDALMQQRKEEYDAAATTAERAERAATTASTAADEALRTAQTARDTAAAEAASATATAASVRRRKTTLVRTLARLEGVSVAVAQRRQDGLAAAARARVVARAEAAAAAAAAAQPKPEPGNAGGPASGHQDQTDEPRTPPAPSGGARAAIAFARAQLGEPYLWGAAGPGSWDCSGLTAGAWAAGGKSLPHYSVAQYDVSTPISAGDLRPGDLVFWGDGGPSTIHHVALYVGDGRIIHAPRTGRPVTEESMYYWRTPDFYARP